MRTGGRENLRSQGQGACSSSNIQIYHLASRCRQIPCNLSNGIWSLLRACSSLHLCNWLQAIQRRTTCTNNTEANCMPCVPSRNDLSSMYITASWQWLSGVPLWRFAKKGTISHTRAACWQNGRGCFALPLPSTYSCRCCICYWSKISANGGAPTEASAARSSGLILPYSWASSATYHFNRFHFLPPACPVSSLLEQGGTFQKKGPSNPSISASSGKWDVFAWRSLVPCILLSRCVDCPALFIDIFLLMFYWSCNNVCCAQA